MNAPNDYRHKLRLGAPPAKGDRRQILISTSQIARLKELRPEVSPSVVVRRLLADYIETLEESDRDQSS